MKKIHILRKTALILTEPIKLGSGATPMFLYNVMKIKNHHNNILNIFAFIYLV